MDLASLLQPEVGYEHGYCRPECTRCSEVCPAGAILKINEAEKSAIHVGYAHIDYEKCLSVSEGVNCGKCSRKCPAGAIEMAAVDPSDADGCALCLWSMSRVVSDAVLARIFVRFLLSAP